MTKIVSRSGEYLGDDEGANDASRWSPRNACGDPLYTDEEIQRILPGWPNLIK